MTYTAKENILDAIIKLAIPVLISFLPVDTAIIGALIIIYIFMMTIITAVILKEDRPSTYVLIGLSYLIGTAFIVLLGLLGLGVVLAAL